MCEINEGRIKYIFYTECLNWLCRIIKRNINMYNADSTNKFDFDKHIKIGEQLINEV